MKYPKNWLEIRQAILDRAKNAHGWPCCEDCGVPNYDFIKRFPDGTWRSGVPGMDDDLVKIILTIGHLDHDPSNCDPRNLKAWCQKCHNVYDMPMRQAGMSSRRRALKAIGDLFK